MNKKKAGPERVVLLIDDTRGHMHQSMGIARWLERLCGADLHEIRVPILSGLKRFRVLKMQGRHLGSASPEEIKKWLRTAGFSTESYTDILSGETVFFQVLQCIHDPDPFILCHSGKHVNPDSLFFTAEIHRNQFIGNPRPFLLQQCVDIR